MKTALKPVGLLAAAVLLLGLASSSWAGEPTPTKPPPAGKRAGPAGVPPKAPTRAPASPSPGARTRPNVVPPGPRIPGAGAPAAAPRPGVVKTTGAKAGTLDTAPAKKVDFDPKTFGQDGGAAAATDEAKVEDVIEWKTNFEKGIKCKKLPLNAKIRLDFQEISLADLTKFISCITEQNFLLSAGAKKAGTVSILSPKPVTAYEAYKAFLSSLDANGLTIVENGKFLEIVPSKDAKIHGAPIRKGSGAPNDDRIVTRLIPLEHVAAEEILPILDKFKTASADITVYAPTNTIFLTDTGRSIRRLVRLIKELDVATGKEKIWIRPIQYAEAGEIVNMLGQLFGGGGKAGAKRTPTRPASRARPARGKPAAAAAAASSVVGSGDSGDLTDIEITKMLADERTNSIIFIASQSVYLKVDRLIRKLDVPIPGEGAIHIHYLENADASDISSALSSLASSSKATARRPGGAAKPTGAGASGGAVGALFEGEVKISPYEPTNALIIESSRKDYMSIQRVIRQLDIQRKQVYVEAILMEISQDKTKDVGISGSGGTTFDLEGETLPLLFGAGGLGLDVSSALETLSGGGGAVGLQGPMIDVSGGASAGDTGASTGASFSIPAFGFLLKAIQTTSNVNVLSTPHILTLDNEEAEINVGKRQPYRNQGVGGGLGSLGSLAGLAGGTASSALGSLGGLGGLGSLAGLGGLGSNVQYVDIDLTLKIKPQVNAADFVKLDIDQKMDELAGFQFDAPVTTKRQVKNVVSVRDGQPVVIGGLMRDAETKSTDKVPVLGDIPLIGLLFRRTKTTIEKRNLLLIIIPHVIKDPSDLKRIYEQRRREYREFARVMAERKKEFEGTVDYRKKNGLLQSMHQRIQEARKDRELREAIILESSDVDTVGPPETHDIEFDPKSSSGGGAR